MERKLLAFVFLLLLSLTASCGYSSNADPNNNIGTGPTTSSVNPQIQIQIANIDQIYLEFPEEHEIDNLEDELFALRNILSLRLARNYSTCLSRIEFEALDKSTLTDELQGLDTDGNPFNNEVTLLVCPTKVNLRVATVVEDLGANGVPVYFPGFIRAQESAENYEINPEGLLYAINAGAPGVSMDFDLMASIRRVYSSQNHSADLFTASYTYMNAVCRPLFYNYAQSLDNSSCGSGKTTEGYCFAVSMPKAPILLERCHEFFDRWNADYSRYGSNLSTDFSVDVEFTTAEESVRQRKNDFSAINVDLSGSIFQRTNENDPDPEPAPTSPIRTLNPLIDADNGGSLKLNRTMAY